MKIYTRTGDEGETFIIGGKVAKDDIRVEAYGTVDELNSFIGQAMSLMDMNIHKYADIRAVFLEIQHELFDCGADLAVVQKPARGYKVNANMVERLEQWIDQFDAECPDITRFILPGGSTLSAVLHVCRTVCRRAERTVVTLAHSQAINAEARKYLNRLSDFLFIAARTANVREGVSDIEYIRSAEVFSKKE